MNFIITDYIKNNAKKLMFIEKVQNYYEKGIQNCCFIPFSKVCKIKKKWKEFRMKTKYFKILIHKLWNKYFPIFSMSLAEKSIENMDQAT